MEHLKKSYALKGETLIKQLKKRGMEGYYCEDKKSALEKIISLIEPKSSVSWGGSQTLNELGIKEHFISGDYKVIDRDPCKGSERTLKMREAFFADYYLTSSNAVSLDGMLVNIDGSGNRVAAISFGPSHVIVVVGINKLVKTVHEAIDRIRNFASPPNCIRIGYPTPCSQSGICMDCLGQNSICGQILVTRNARPEGRIKVILVGESLGY